MQAKTEYNFSVYDDSLDLIISNDSLLSNWFEVKMYYYTVDPGYKKLACKKYPLIANAYLGPDWQFHSF